MRGGGAQTPQRVAGVPGGLAAVAFLAPPPRLVPEAQERVVEAEGVAGPAVELAAGATPWWKEPRGGRRR